jgi:hypothetical protein
MRKDDSGQFLLLTSIVVSIGLVILLIYMNQSSVAGHASSESIMNFPKNDIRELKAETVNQAYLTAVDVNEDPSLGALGGTGRQDAFNDSFKVYIAEVKSFYLEKGANVNITNLGCSFNASEAPANQTLQTVNLSIYYDDSETTYDEVDSVNIV